MLNSIYEQGVRFLQSQQQQSNGDSSSTTNSTAGGGGYRPVPNQVMDQQHTAAAAAKVRSNRHSFGSTSDIMFHPNLAPSNKTTANTSGGGPSSKRRTKSDSEDAAIPPTTTSPRSITRKGRAGSHAGSQGGGDEDDDDEDDEDGSVTKQQQPQFDLESQSNTSSQHHQQREVILGPGIPTSASNAILSVGGFHLQTIKQHASDFNLQSLADLQQRTAIQMQTRFPMLGPAFWACFFYSLVSTSMVLVNKLLLSTYKFRFPMVLMFHQNLMTVNSLYIAKEMGVTTYEPLEKGKVLKWLPMDIFFVLMLLTGFYSVELLSVPMITIFKNTNNIFISLGDALLFGNIPSQGVIWTMVLMLLAAVMAGLNDLEYTYTGYMWTLANCLASAAFVLYAQTAIAKTNLSTFGKVYYNNVLALPLVAIADYFVFGDFGKLFSAEKEEILRFLSLDFVFLWFLSGVLGFLQSLSSLRAQHLTSPTTYSMVGSLNKIPMTFLGVYIFHTPMTAKSVLYVSLSIIAGGLYSYTKAKEDIAARAAAREQKQQQSTTGKDEVGLKQAAEVQEGDIIPNSSVRDFSGGGGPHLRHLPTYHAGSKMKTRSQPTPQVDEGEIVPLKRVNNGDS